VGATSHVRSEVAESLVATDLRAADRLAAVLYDWIRAQALIPPKLKLRCVGAHFEIPHRDEVVQDNGVTRHRRKGQTERVVDFDFFVSARSQPY
jgi:hypothetical protein